jgi:hypothetical protein
MSARECVYLCAHARAHCALLQARAVLATQHGMSHTPYMRSAAAAGIQLQLPA